MTNYKLERRIEEILFQNTRVNPNEDRIVTDVWQLRDKFYELVEDLLQKLAREDEEYAEEAEDLLTIEDFLNRNIK